MSSSDDAQYERDLMEFVGVRKTPEVLRLVDEACKAFARADDRIVLRSCLRGMPLESSDVSRYTDDDDVADAIAYTRRTLKAELDWRTRVETTYRNDLCELGRIRDNGYDVTAQLVMPQLVAAEEAFFVLVSEDISLARKCCKSLRTAYDLRDPMNLPGVRADIVERINATRRELAEAIARVGDESNSSPLERVLRAVPAWEDRVGRTMDPELRRHLHELLRPELDANPGKRPCVAE